jgi:hypothetical protein
MACCEKSLALIAAGQHQAAENELAKLRWPNGRTPAALHDTQDAVRNMARRSNANRASTVNSSAAKSAARDQAARAKITDSRFIDALAAINQQQGTNWHQDFKKTWELIMARRYKDAADELGWSRWARKSPADVRAAQDALRALRG